MNPFDRLQATGLQVTVYFSYNRIDRSGQPVLTNGKCPEVHSLICSLDVVWSSFICHRLLILAIMLDQVVWKDFIRTARDDSRPK